MKHLKLIFACLLMAVLSIGQVWGTEAVYKQTIFSADNNEKGVQNYTSTWTNTTDGFIVTTVNANNNNNGWSGTIKIGTKTNASTGTITTNAAIDKAITKVTLTIDAIAYPDNVTSITLKTSSNGSSWTSAGTFTKEVGAKTVTLASPTADLYYQIEVICTGATKNGCIQFNQIDFYAEEGGGGGSSNPTLSSVTVSGTPSTTTYEAGDAFDASGLTVTGTYSDESEKAIESGITWTACKTQNGTYVALDNAAVKLAKDETGIYVKATVGGKTSQAFPVTGLTVTAALPKSTLVFEDEYKDSGATADDNAEWEVTSDATESTYEAARGIHFGTNSSSQVQYVQLTTSDIAGTIKQVVVNAADAAGTATISVSVGGTDFTYSGSTTVANTNPGSNYTFTGSKSGGIIVRIDRGSAAYKGIYIKSIVVTYEEAAVTQVATPVITGTDNFYPTTSVSITCGTDGATIYYTTDGSDPASSGTKSTYSTPFTLDATKTVKAIAVKTSLDNSEVASKVFTLVEPLATMQAIFNAASTTGNQIITFSNTWVVTGVSTNGKNAYLTDGTKGLILYNSSASDQSPVAGLAKDKTLSGTVTRNLTLYNSAAELTDFTADGLTIGDGTTPNVNVLDAEGIAALSAVNTGSLIKISGQCIYENSKYYIKYGNGDNDKVQVYNTLYAFESMTANANYEVTGVYIQFNAIKEIAPRSSADIVQEVVKTQPETQWNATAKTVRMGDATTGWWSTSSDGAKSFNSSNPEVATITNAGVITLVAPGTTTLTFSTAETGTYYAGNASLTLTVKAALPAGASEFTWVAAEMVGVENGTAVTTATGNEDPISIVFAQGEGSNAPKYYTSGSAVRSYVQNTITISSAVEGKLIYGVEIVFANSTNNKLNGDDLSVDGTSGTWSGLAQEVVFNVPNVSGNQAHLVSINVIYADGTVTTLSIANVAMKTTDEPLQIVPTCNVTPTPAISYEIATADQAYATIDNGIITPHEVTSSPISVTASIAQGSNYTAAVAYFTITVSEKQMPALSFPAASYNANLGNTFTAPTLTNPEHVTVAYSSSEEGVATVNASTGDIELVGEGTTTITAAFAGNGDYAANSAFYTLNVADPNKDVLTAVGIGQSNYGNWSKSFTTTTVYAGNSTANNGDIQLRKSSGTQDASGIVTTSIAGYLNYLSATAGTNANAEGHYLNVYAKNTAYQSVADLYDEEKCGTLIGTIAEAGGEIDFVDGKAYTDNYKYIALKSNNGAAYYGNIIVKWTPATFNKYTVTYAAGDATGDDVVVNNIEEGTTIQLQDNAYSYAGHVFTGWSDGNNVYEEGDDYTVNGNVTFTAQWAQQFNVTYNPGEAGGDAIVRTVAAGAYNLESGNIFTYAGHSFDGWLKDETKYNAGASYPISENVAFTAQWVEAPDPVTVTFVAGTDKSGTMTLTKGGISLSYPSEGGTFNREDDYRCYSGKTLTIASEVGNITNIAFTLTQNTFTTETGTYENGSWNGSAESIVFTTSGGQVRMTQISVTYIPNGNTPKQPAGLSYDPTSYSIAQNESFTAPTLNNPNNLVVTYSGNNDDVATVDAATGAITLGEATGTVTITATAEAQGNFNAGTASYTLTVTAPVVIDDLTGTWQLVTAASQLVAGKKVIIASVPDAGAAVTMSTTQATNNRSGLAGATVSEGVITAQNGTAVFTIEAGTVDNTIAFKSSADEYLYAASSENNYIRSQETNDANGSWIVTISEGVATITAQGDNTRNIMRYNPNTAGNNPIFACYGSNSTIGTLVTLYMLEESTPEPPVLDWQEVRTGLESGRHYTVCLEKNITAIDGATFWNLQYKNAGNTEVYLVEETAPEAGKPYIFQATKATLKVVYGDEVAGAPVENGALRGTFGYMDKDALAAAGSNIYMLFNNALRPLGTNNHLDAHRAYVLYGELQAVDAAPVPAQGRRVKSMPMQPQVATDVDAINASENPMKLMIDGQIYILRGEKLYDVTGKLVK